MELTPYHANRIKEEIDALALVITPYWNTLVANPSPPEAMDFEDEDRIAMLKSCTLIVRLLDLSIACYPLSVVAVYLLDENGDPLP